MGKSRTTEWNDISDPDVRRVWERVFIDVEFHRRSAAMNGVMPDPEWQEWQDDARRVLGLSDAAYVNDDYQIVDPQ